MGSQLDNETPGGQPAPGDTMALGAIPESFIALKCWSRACNAPLASIEKRRGHADVRCRICGSQWLMWVERATAPHGGESWAVTLVETAPDGQPKETQKP
jgi:hypothetical protein